MRPISAPAAPAPPAPKGALSRGRRLAHAWALVAALASGLVLSGCEETAADLRFHTPMATVETLFAAFGVEALDEASIRDRMQRGRRFHLQDPASFRACFADWERPEDEGLAGFVFGGLAASKDNLRLTLTEGEATVFPLVNEQNEGRPVILRQLEGEWKIVLRQSVPASVRRRLYEVHRRSEAQLEAAGYAAP